MMRYPAADDFARVAKELLSPEESRRYLANDLLFGMFMLLQTADDQTLGKSFAVKSSNMIPDRSAFLAALLSFWACISEDVHIKWMGSFQRPGKLRGKGKDAGWYSQLEEFYPIKQVCEDKALKPSMALFMGIQAWLENAVGPQDIALIPQLLACLEHPEPVCQDTAVKLLGAIGLNANGSEALMPALSALQKRISEKGSWCSPFIDGVAVAGIIGSHTDVWLKMANGITAGSEVSEVQAYCATFCIMSKPPAALLDCLLGICGLMPQQEEEKLRSLLLCIAQLAHKSNYRCDDVRQLILPFVRSASTVLRSAAAQALGYVAQLPEDEVLLVKLSQDEDGWVRNGAHRGARCVATPSPELVQRTAKDLNVYDLYDGLPHDDAVETLAGWGAHIDAAYPEIERWLKAVAKDPSCYGCFDEQELVLVESLGDRARPLLPLLEKCYEGFFSEGEDDGCDDDGDHENDDGDLEDGDFSEEAFIEDGLEETDRDFLEMRKQALAVIRTRLQETSAQLQARDDKDLDTGALMAVKEWETRIPPLLEQYLREFEQNGGTLRKEVRIQVNRLIKEGEDLLLDLAVKSVSNIVGDLEFDVDDGIYDHKESLSRAFMEEMGVGDLEVPDHEGPSSENEVKERFLRIIDQLQAG